MDMDLLDLLEATVEPSKVISDQYKGSTVVTNAGQTYNGRLVAENDTHVTILTSPDAITWTRRSPGPASKIPASDARCRRSVMSN